MSFNPLKEIRRRLENLEREQQKLMSATTDLQAAQATLDKAVQDTITYLQATISGGVSATDAETIVADLNAKAAALEAAIAPPAPATT
jgi:predicted transcriptional regulator